MTAFNLTCEAVEATLLDYLDETLEPWLRQSIDEHLRECARCADLLRDLRELESEAASLPALVPDRDLWSEIARDIGPPVMTAMSSEPSPVINKPSLPTSQPPVPAGELLLRSAEAQLPVTAPEISLAERREKRWAVARTSARAAALVVVTAGTTFLLTVRFGPARTTYVVTDTSATRRLSSSAVPPPGRGIPAPPVERQQIASDSSALNPPAGPVRSSQTAATTSAPQVTRSPEEVVYDKEINMLQAMTRRRKTGLDPSTAAVIERNLRIIDSNIAQIRAALQQDPGNSLLDDQVSRALDMKVELLRRVALLRFDT